MKYVEWLEPYSHDPLTNVICKMTVDDVILIQKHKASAKGYTYKCDEDAIWDFIAIHWGKLIEENNV